MEFVGHCDGYAVIQHSSVQGMHGGMERGGKHAEENKENNEKDSEHKHGK